jgi:hypothetical protein
MVNDVTDDVGVADDVEIEPPIPIDPRLPAISGLVVLLGVQGGMAKVLLQERHLFEKCLAHLGRGFFESF